MPDLLAVSTENKHDRISAELVGVWLPFLHEYGYIRDKRLGDNVDNNESVTESVA